jgi:hypothetical protein
VVGKYLPFLWEEMRSTILIKEAELAGNPQYIPMEEDGNIC